MSLSSRIAKVYLYNNHFKGLPKETDLKFVQETLRSLKDGEYLASAVYLKVGPDPQIFVYPQKLGATFAGTQIAKIIESKNRDFPVDKYVVGNFGWRTLTIGNDVLEDGSKPYLVPETGKLPISSNLGALGIPGVAAYFGFLEICKPQKNDVVVVSSAAGAVGNLVGQIAKLKDCTVIGITSSDDKGKWLIDELGFNYYINYKTQDVSQKLKEYGPAGIDCYFDNVGGEISSAVIYNMKTFGRICICGATSLYCTEDIPSACEVQTPIKIKHVTMEGIQVNRWKDNWSEAIEQNLKWIQEKKLKYKETIINDIENAFQAFYNTLQGNNTGNVIIKV
ncbi:hypothetical protein ILUMI_05987 [Ignelater luminosus]|uniref:15-oxoprostaglandin 13-reductase n=1 Tax=Ignelater luminosus TaxID=2038154 RepID=A0A8K0GFU8_IGNLU|nr:hypothetical protein ILUMI_05987 [Ignelater luminosus]